MSGNCRWNGGQYVRAAITCLLSADGLTLSKGSPLLLVLIKVNIFARTRQLGNTASPYVVGLFQRGRHLPKMTDVTKHYAVVSIRE